MCFSTEVSFSSAIVLILVGCATLRLSKKNSEVFLAAIPLFFGFQQFAEGLVWHGLNLQNLEMQRFGMYLFLFFAMIFWPIYLPFSIYKVENQAIRKKILIIPLLSGIALSLVNAIYGLQKPMIVEAKDFSLRYLGNVPEEKYLYMAITLLPSFISSFPKLWIFGIILTATALLASYFYFDVFVSLWCFAAAISSIGLYWVFRKQTINS